MHLLGVKKKQNFRFQRTMENPRKVKPKCILLNHIVRRYRLSRRYEMAALTQSSTFRKDTYNTLTLNAGLLCL